MMQMLSKKWLLTCEWRTEYGYVISEAESDKFFFLFFFNTMVT